MGYKDDLNWQENRSTKAYMGNEISKLNKRIKYLEELLKINEIDFKN